MAEIMAFEISHVMWAESDPQGKIYVQNSKKIYIGYLNCFQFSCPAAHCDSLFVSKTYRSSYWFIH